MYAQYGYYRCDYVLGVKAWLASPLAGRSFLASTLVLDFSSLTFRVDRFCLYHHLLTLVFALNPYPYLPLYISVLILLQLPLLLLLILLLSNLLLLIYPLLLQALLLIAIIITVVAVVISQACLILRSTLH